MPWNAVLVAALMWSGAVSFKKVLKEEVKDKDNQLPYAFQVRWPIPTQNLGKRRKHPPSERRQWPAIVCIL